MKDEVKASRAKHIWSYFDFSLKRLIREGDFDLLYCFLLDKYLPKPARCCWDPILLLEFCFHLEEDLSLKLQGEIFYECYACCKAVAKGPL